ncbi:hypothetical protein [Hymenobacter cellulosilyticus]|uniref:PorT family protein n=1 Tax=Hymenobacter cellulosilyticus TaxID=2932248 RepID=A0A8T9Q6Q9_9BACT|nr:hypothetical protein [Hymenobacter cellulosilyticus]UOQ71688.1 hypothetical protein MUN79_24270 [Hymenobacter cellulosilyticus]
MKHFYTTALLLGLAVATQAQGLPGYVLTLSGDSLRGTLIETDHRQIALYRPTDSLPTTFRAAQVRGYRVGQRPALLSRVVRLASGADSVRFTFPLRTGTVGLYSSSGNDLLLRPAAQDTLFELTPQNWHLLFHRYLSRCAGLQQTSDQELSKPFYQAEIQRQIEVYNQCASSSQPERAVKGPAYGWLTYYGLVGGPTLTVLHFSSRSMQPDRSIPDVGYMLGVEAVKVSPGGTQVSGQLSLSQSVSHTGPYITYPQPVLTTEAIDYRFRRLTPILTVGRRFLQTHSVSPFVALGIATSVLFDQESLVTTQVASKAAVTEKFVGESTIDPFVDVTAGIWVKSFSTTAWRLSAQYHWRYVHSTIAVPYISILTLQAGFFFGSR